jgi:hypothetical protein
MGVICPRSECPRHVGKDAAGEEDPDKKEEREENRRWKKTMCGRVWKKTQPEEDPPKKTRLSNRLI